MDEWKRRRRGQIPAFGEWDLGNQQLPITQYFECATALHFHPHLPLPPLKKAQETRRKRRLNVNVNVKKEKEEKEEDERRRRRRARKRKEERRAKAVVDEDLYHIPPHLLLPSSNRHTHTLRTKVVRFFSNCLLPYCATPTPTPTPN